MATAMAAAGGRRLLWRCLLAYGLAVQPQAATATTPQVEVRRALMLAGEPLNEDLATKNQAMGVWRDDQVIGRELVVALIHQYRDMDRRADDRQFAVAWESDGQTLREVHRVPMSCPDVELVVPSRGPYVYEARLVPSPYSMHPECSCQPAPGRPCPVGVQAVWNGTGLNLSSPVNSHFVSLENEWRELIDGPAVLGRLQADVDAPVVPVSQRVLNATQMANADASMGCPGSRDELIGGPDVTKDQLIAQGMRLPVGHVDGRWCLVNRGGCSETAKVKVCEVSGAVGTIIVDHGNFQGDQDIVIRYSQSAKEGARRPVLFVSMAEGKQLAAAAAAPGGASVRVGPGVAGQPPPGYAPGSGIVVHRMTGGSNETKAYPEIFAAAAWLEVSDIRHLLFVCIPSEAQIQIFDVSHPLVSITKVGTIARACRRSGSHDYRILDYVDKNGRFMTVLVDPADQGNRLFYYDTHDIAAPRLLKERQVAWEALHSGLGQVRPGGPSGRYHLVTWHCSNLYCGKNHGDSLYAIDSQDLLAPAAKVMLPMPTVGSFARDIACGSDNICLVSLTWDGLVAVDVGARDTVNMFSAVAGHASPQTFGSANIPYHVSHMRMWSGAQKVYSSRVHPRRFYVEHANFSLRQLQVGDTVRAIQLKEVYVVEVKDYDPSIKSVFGWSAQGNGPAKQRHRKLPRAGALPTTMLILGIFVAMALIVLVGLLLLVLRTRLRCQQQHQLDRQIEQAGRSNTGANVVVGRPVEAGEASIGPAGNAWPASAAGQPVVTPEQAKGQGPPGPAASAAGEPVVPPEQAKAQEP